jgi:hypothetical protein
MTDVIDPNDESRIRYRARRRGFQVVRTRGREEKRRRACGQGDLMLLDQTQKELMSGRWGLADAIARSLSLKTLLLLGVAR